MPCSGRRASWPCRSCLNSFLLLGSGVVEAVAENEQIRVEALPLRLQLALLGLGVPAGSAPVDDLDVAGAVARDQRLEPIGVGVPGMDARSPRERVADHQNTGRFTLAIEPIVAATKVGPARAPPVLGVDGGGNEGLIIEGR